MPVNNVGLRKVLRSHPHIVQRWPGAIYFESRPVAVRAQALHEVLLALQSLLAGPVAQKPPRSAGTGRNLLLNSLW